MPKSSLGVLLSFHHTSYVYHGVPISLQVQQSTAFCLHKRKFIPLDTNKYAGLTSPRMYCDYDPSNIPGKRIQLFKASLENSFNDVSQRINFINKMIQCALGRGLPLKLKKLIACGQQDSGKTSWMSILRGELQARQLMLCYEAV